VIPKEFWIVVAQYDSNAAGFQYGPPAGPIVFESYCMTEDQAEERAKSLGTQYGWVVVMKVENPWYKEAK